MSLINSAALNELLNDPHSQDLVILYTTMKSGPGVIPDIVLQIQPAYIEGSIFFDFQNVFVDKSHASKHMMPSSEQFQQQVRKLGINNNSKIVVYDDFGNFCASRVWFMFKSMGHNDISILDGGLPDWLRNNFKTDDTLKVFDDFSESGNFVANPNHRYQFLSKDQLTKIDMQQTPFFDARSNARFIGTSESRVNRSEGHIPGMVNLHYKDVQDANGKFLSPNALDKLFPKLERLGFSCGSGVTACILAQAANLAGRNELLVYDGSWSEWSSDSSLPIA